MVKLHGIGVQFHAKLFTKMFIFFVGGERDIIRKNQCCKCSKLYVNVRAGWYMKIHIEVLAKFEF